MESRALHVVRLDKKYLNRRQLLSVQKQSLLKVCMWVSWLHSYQWHRSLFSDTTWDCVSNRSRQRVLCACALLLWRNCRKQPRAHKNRIWARLATMCHDSTGSLVPDKNYALVSLLTHGSVPATNHTNVFFTRATFSNKVYINGLVVWICKFV